MRLLWPVTLLFALSSGAADAPAFAAPEKQAAGTKAGGRPGISASDAPQPPPRPLPAAPKSTAPEIYGPALPLPSITAIPPPASAGTPAVDTACREALNARGAVFTEAAVPKAPDDQCSVDNPVKLTGVTMTRGTTTSHVTLAGSPLLSCETALAATDWIQQSVAPLARGHFDDALSEIGVGGGFECRQRNHQAKAPRSEHSYGRALDVMSFRIGSRVIRVEKSPPADAKAFLDAVWASACGKFSTALGPAADAFHETHIHVDLQPRRAPSSKFCE